MNRRTVGILVLLAVVAFYAFGTGFSFFYRFLYALLLLLSLGLIWAWVNLRGIDVRLTRTATRGQVGGYLEGRVYITNRTRLPKSWLEVVEYSDLPDYGTGRGLAMVKAQARTWRVQTYLSRRGVFHTGQVDVISQDPFGLFRLKRRFLEPETYVVLPATEPLPNMDPRLASLPSDSRTMKHWDQITTDVSSVREYAPGDSYRRIHWPYTARMNTLMVKEFDIGISAEAWVLLDMNHVSHVGELPDNTEELAVTIAASIINRLVEKGMPVGLAVNGDQDIIYRPDSSPVHQGRLMEVLAQVRAEGITSLERFLYDMRPQLSRFNTLTIITPSARPEWVPALNSLRRQGVNLSVVLVDPESFGQFTGIQVPLQTCVSYEIPTYIVRRGQALNDALSSSVNIETRPGGVYARAGAGKSAS